MQILSTVILPLLALVGLVAAGPVVERRSSFTLKNGQDAQALNKKFASLSPSSKCTSGEVACVQGAFAQCVNGKFVTTPCSGGLTCVALPLVNSPGTRFVLLARDRCSPVANFAIFQRHLRYRIGRCSPYFPYGCEGRDQGTRARVVSSSGVSLMHNGMTDCATGVPRSPCQTASRLRH